MRVKKEQEEKIIHNTKQTSVANQNNTNAETDEKGLEHTGVPIQPTSDTLTAVLSSTEASEEEWPQKVFLTVINRFGRMPRGGWKKANDVFCEKYGSNMGVDEFKCKAKKALTSTSGRQMSAREFKSDPTREGKPKMAPEKRVVSLKGEPS